MFPRLHTVQRGGVWYIVLFVRSIVRQLVLRVVAFVFPPTCILCATEHVGTTTLCSQCLSLLSVYRQPQCFPCACLGIVRSVPECGAHNYCDIATIVALGPYTSLPLRTVVRRLKYGFLRLLARDACFALIPHLRECCPGAERDSLTLIVPVPLSSRRERWRGFNQSHVIAEELARAMRYSMIPALVRVRHGASNTTKARSERIASSIDLYVCRPGLDLHWYRRIILVDDVMTTGATLRSCAHALRSAGFSGEIVGCVLAIEERSSA